MQLFQKNGIIILHPTSKKTWQSKVKIDSWSHIFNYLINLILTNHFFQKSLTSPSMCVWDQENIYY